MNTQDVLLALCLLLYLSRTKSTKLTVNREGGYNGLVIALSSSVEEDEVILENLKELLTNASAALHVATRGAMFFEDVTISLPSTWSNKPEYERTVKDNFRDADIKIDDNSFSVEPDTIQGGDCYEQGQYIQMSPQYLKDIKDPQITKAVGYPDKRFVQEWAKFRYGVFDESVTVEEPGTKFYYVDQNGDTIPTVCSADIALTGFNEDERGDQCDPAASPEDCHFVVDEQYVTVESSLMYSSSLSSVTTFCDNTAKRKHNHMAPSKHNVKCKNRSTWEVITSHKDFAIRKVPAAIRVRDTVPNFRVIRTIGGGGRVVLVLDISGSMMGTPMQLLTQTAKRHITDNAPEGTELGIVSFGTRANALHAMTKVDAQTRQGLANAIPTQANGGGTAIGRGLLTGIDVLKGSGQLEGSVILLITDGEENEAPYIDSVLPTLIDEGIVVSVIAYGEKASDKLEQMAIKTGGTASIFRDIHNAEANTAELNKKIMEATTVQADVAFEPVQLVGQSVVLSDAEVSDTVYLEPELGKNTVFTFSITRKIGLVVELRDPSGNEYNWQSKEYYKDATGKVITFKYAEAENGTWSFTLKRPSDETTDLDMSLSSEPKDVKKQPVRVSSWLSTLEIKPPNFPKIIAMVTKTGKPVLSLTVEAYITGPNDYFKTVTLLDNGQGPDGGKNDGIYSGYITEFKGDGRYSVRAKVTGGKGARLKRPKMGKNVKKMKRIKRAENEEDYEDIEVVEEERLTEDPSLLHLQRVQDAGVFRLVGWKEDLSDAIAPARVTDLEVLYTAWGLDGNTSVTLRWTESGDDLDIGNASVLELRLSREFDSLLLNFENTTSVEESLLNAGNLNPGIPQMQKMVTLSVPLEHLDNALQSNDNISSNVTNNEGRTTLYFALRYHDESDNVGDVSNIAYGLFVRELPPVVPTTTQIYKTTTDTRNQVLHGDGNDNGEYGPSTSVIMIAVVISLITGVAFLAAALYYLKLRPKYNIVTTEMF